MKLGWSVTEKENKDGDIVVSLTVKLAPFDSTRDAKRFLTEIRKSTQTFTGQGLIEEREN